ncbi:hypothetical protein FHX81_3981 [Saccharothrix saharensis]|uniref:Uncharacterized protein n=2 Tax=Saccharothrix saharensis TaxID=571190 RepID=A0A543JFI6_9PSEU|nr:hypothetical protein FHX81_3981 [Saccharothrix saharensis]
MEDRTKPGYRLGPSSLPGTFPALVDYGVSRRCCSIRVTFSPLASGVGDGVVATVEVMAMVTMVVLTVLALPLAVLAARVGRRRWVRRAVARAELFRHWVPRDEPSGHHLIRS